MAVKRRKSRSCKKRSHKKKVLYTIFCKNKKCKIYKVYVDELTKKRYIKATIGGRLRTVCVKSSHRCFTTKKSAMKVLCSVNRKPVRCLDFTIRKVGNVSPSTALVPYTSTAYGNRKRRRQSSFGGFSRIGSKFGSGFNYGFPKF